MNSREEPGRRRTGGSRSGASTQLRLLAPWRQSWEQFGGLTVMYALVVSLVMFAVSAGEPAQIVPTLSMFGAVLEPAFGWALPTAIAFVALAHVAVIGGELDPEKHRVYLSALSVASVFVTAGMAVSSILIMTSWLAAPERFILLLPLLPLLGVLIVVGLQLGRFNNVDAETELRFVERELSRVESKRRGLRPQSLAWSLTTGALHTLALLSAASGALLIITGGHASVLEVIFGAAVAVVLGFIAAVPAYFDRVSVDRLTRGMWQFFYWSLPALLIFGGLVLPLALGVAALVLVFFPIVLVQLSFATAARQIPFTMAGSIDALAARSLATQVRRLESRRLVLVAELDQLRPSVMKKLRDLVRRSGV